MKNILIVDDEPGITDAFAELFYYEENLCVRVAHDGRAALELCAQETFSVVVLDWRLRGDLQGRDVLLRLKSDYPHMLVLVVTASIHAISEIESLQPFDCLLKPCPDLKDRVMRIH